MDFTFNGELSLEPEFGTDGKLPVLRNIHFGNINFYVVQNAIAILFSECGFLINVYIYGYLKWKLFVCKRLNLIHSFTLKT